MNFLIVTHVPHRKDGNHYSAYAPYVNEMNIWATYVKKLVIIAPLITGETTAIDSAYTHPNIEFIPVEDFDLLTISNSIKSLVKLPIIGFKVFKAMKASDHIHLRCPGNMGLIGCVVQLLFPKKRKTAKYAGNWDSKAAKPWTYRLQQQILSNVSITKNMQVLVYGQWEQQTNNIKSFFTATYSQNEIIPLQNPVGENIFQFLFVGALVKGKNPLYAIQLIQELKKKGHDVSLKLYGEGIERKNLEQYILNNKLHAYISLEGNKSRADLKVAYQESQFVLLPSNSEGWPKAIAEGMFWGCVPVATAVSCVPFMLDYGKRGILVAMSLNKDTQILSHLLTTPELMNEKRVEAYNWSTKYTLERFEAEILLLLNS